MNFNIFILYSYKGKYGYIGMDELKELNEVEDVIMPQVIKHIVMSGGGICGFAFYGALRESEKMGFWNIEMIESIYGTSIGSFFAILIALKKQFDWETLDDFLIKRPWDEFFQMQMGTLYGAIIKKGLLDRTFIVQTFEPLFKAVDLSIDITLKEFYEYTNIDVHIIVSKIIDFLNPRNSEFVLENMNHITHGNWKVVDAVYCSACLPIMFQPYIIENTYYIDGGLLCNYPLCLCKNDYNINDVNEINTIFGLCSHNDNREIEVDGLFDYIFAILMSMWHKITRKTSLTIKNEISMKTSSINIKDIYETAKLKDVRMKWINIGCEQWTEFYKKTYM